MDKAAYQHWWALHVRSVRGEPLTHEEAATYTQELKRLHDEEVLVGDFQRMREARDVVMALDSICEQLHERRRELKERVARLEADLSPDVRRQLGIEG
jgi:polyhydroxyalkanoate synthesis regulator phasin